jgi:hypothetical protein
LLPLPLWSSGGSGVSSLDLFEPPSVPVVVGVEAGGGVSSEPDEPEPDEPEPDDPDPDEPEPDEPDPEWDEPPSSLDVVLPPPDPE